MAYFLGTHTLVSTAASLVPFHHQSFGESHRYGVLPWHTHLGFHGSFSGSVAPPSFGGSQRYGVLPRQTHLGFYGRFSGSGDSRRYYYSATATLASLGPASQITPCTTTTSADRYHPTSRTAIGTGSNTTRGTTSSHFTGFWRLALTVAATGQLS